MCGFFFFYSVVCGAFGHACNIIVSRVISILQYIIFHILAEILQDISLNTAILMYSVQWYSASFPNTASLVSSKFIFPFWVFVCLIGISPLHGSHVVFYIPLKSMLWLFLFHNNCCMIHGWCSSTVAWFMYLNYSMIHSPLMMWMMWIGYSLHLHRCFSPSFPHGHHLRFSFYPSFLRSKFVESFLYFVFFCLWVWVVFY